MHKIITAILIMVIAFSSFCQSADERIEDMINRSSWFELRDFFKTDTDSVSPFLKDFGYAMLAHFSNNPREAVSRSKSLINDYGSELELDNVLAISQLMALDLKKLGRNDSAACVLSRVLDSTKQYLDDDAIAQFRNQIERYSSLANYSPYTVSKIDTIISIPLRVDTISILEDRPPVVMAFIPDCKINDNICDVHFDTGAGMNVISNKRADEMGLKRLDAQITAYGSREIAGVPLAIADSLIMNGITIYDVPFMVLDLVTGNEILDKHLEKSEIVIGFEVMNALRHINLDFQNSCINVSGRSFIPGEVQGNMMLTDGNNILVKGMVGNQPVIIHPDSGDASNGMFFSGSWPFMKTFVAENLQPVNGLIGGAGGYDEITIYKIKNVPLTIASATVNIPQIDLSENYGKGDECDARMGLKTFLLFRNVAFDMERMVMYPVN